MRQRLTSFSRSAARHGVAPTLLRSAYRQLRRLVSFEVCWVQGTSEAPYDWPPNRDYDTRPVSREEFHARLCDELAGTDYHWAFDRGDLVIATLKHGEVVGFTLYTRHATRVQPGLVFAVPKHMLYVFGSMTAPSHRGHRLEPERWRVARALIQQRDGHDVPQIWYNNVTNLEVLAAHAGAGDAPRRYGVSGYARLFGRWWCFTSPACRRLGAGFRAVPPAAQPSPAAGGG